MIAVSPEPPAIQARNPGQGSEPPTKEAAEQGSSAPAPSARAGAQPRRARVDAVDWLRGLAVVLMIQTHLYDAWCNAAAKATVAYSWSRFLGGIPSRLFMLLVGVAMAIKFEAQLGKGASRGDMVRGAARRGLEIVALAYLFRFQEWVLGGMGSNWPDLFRVDILNCIGASMIATAFVAAPRNGRPATPVALAVAALAIALGPLVGPAHFPGWLPRPLTSYLGGQRPMSWFPIFPWVAWPLIGVALGHWWVRASRIPGKLARAFLITGVVGFAMTWAVILIRRADPYIIRYPSDVVQQMGPGTFFFRLGYMGPIALGAYLVTQLWDRLGVRFSMMRQLGQTSLLVYWIHVDLCYGLLFARFHHKLSMAEATVGFVAMTLGMLGVSVLKSRYWKGLPPLRRQRPATHEVPAPALPGNLTGDLPRNLPSGPRPL
jgi:uncharacterized membrane protein